MNIPAPQQLFVEVTSNCNLRCPHCYVEAGSGPLRQIPLAALAELIAEFAAMNGSRFTLSGGEPTLFRHWREALLRARACGLEAEIITNATRLTDEDIDFLHRNRIFIDISFESMDEETNDTVRGSGSFAKTKDALVRISRAGLGPMTTVCFTPMAANAYSLRDLALWSEGVGIGRVYISLLEHRGRARANESGVHMSAAQRYHLLETVIDLQAKNGITVICPNLRFFPERILGHRVQVVPIDRTMRVTADMDLYLSAYLDHRDFHLGRYTPGELVDAWYNEKVRRAYLAAKSRERLIPACRSCNIFELCQGGSAMLAWNEAAGFYSVDNFCAAKQQFARNYSWAETAAC